MQKAKPVRNTPYRFGIAAQKKTQHLRNRKHLSLIRNYIYEPIQAQQQVLPDSWFSVRRYLLKGKSSISDGFTKVGFGLSK